MKRDIYKALLKWKGDTGRRPLILRGARQIGKTYIINQFGNKEFNSFISLNFERNPEYLDIFSDFDPQKIIEKIALFIGKKVEPGKTLLFLDEIQDCPKAIMSLRYFYEEMPELHIIGAGSLLEFTLNAENYRVPVGRVQYAYMKPMSFGEFIDASGDENLRTYLSDFSNIEMIPDGLHNKLNELVRMYMIIGGMPAVVNEYVTTKDVLKCQKIQQGIIETFIDDFGKYSKAAKYPYLQKVFNSVPSIIGNKFIYSKVDDNVRSRDLKLAVELLTQAGILHRVQRTSGAGIPLEAGVNDKFFKLIFLDIGLMQAISGVYTETAKQKDFTAIFKGAIAEQFVGQEIIAYHTPEIRSKLYYWAREARNSNAEVDYILEKNLGIVPVEIKSGAKGRMKSLYLFIEKFNTELALKISQAKYNNGRPVVDLPFYAIQPFLENT
jgi:predicted AAA+ superfamily ATPase